MVPAPCGLRPLTPQRSYLVALDDCLHRVVIQAFEAGGRILVDVGYPSTRLGVARLGLAATQALRRVEDLPNADALIWRFRDRDHAYPVVQFTHVDESAAYWLADILQPCDVSIFRSPEPVPCRAVAL